VTRANCPSCGAPVEFAIGSSAVVVCTYCRSVVARTDRGVETHGKVAALIDTGSPLAVGVHGRYGGTGFRITGRTQLRHQAGGVWDEWYAAFDDGRWGWLAEAQGRLYVTFKTASAAPLYEQLRLGATVAGLEPLVVAELGEAVVASAEGELPWRPEPGASYAYADLTGEEQRFATIDYSEEPPVVFKGTETTFAELGITGDAARTTRVSAATLNCTKCGGPLELKVPDRAERIWCPNCGAGHDIAQGKLKYFAMLPKKRPDRVIANGATGTVDGVTYVVAGFMQRAVVFDQTYYWTEYLLYNRETGYRWLVHSDDHWSFVTPLRPGEVVDSNSSYVAKTVSYEGRRYKLFQVATAKVTYVDGEFYWRVSVGEAVDTADYIAPPFGISREVTTEGARELSYSHARYMTAGEVEKAFGVEKLPRPHLPGPIQPYSGPRLGCAWAVMLALLMIVAIALAVTRPGRQVLERDFDLLAVAPPADAPPNARIVFSEPFELTGEHNVAIDANASVQNSWLAVTGDLVNEATGAIQTFDLPIEYYSGVDGGESWSEGKRTRAIYIGRPDKGRYVLRLETQWEEGKMPPPLHVRVREGVFRLPHLLLALLAISIFPVIALILQAAFEGRRWQESAYSPFGQIKTDDDEDDEE
jgi:DNA-directed RNA polymerase subunit RPC12/RpoP